MSATKSTPRDAQVMMAILKEMGVADYEPRVINQMLEFVYRYVTDILEDAKVYCAHSGKKTVDVSDIKLSIESRLDRSFTTPPPKDLLMEIAKHKNSTPLPMIKPYTGPKLPPDRYCLSTANYRLKTLKKPRLQLSQTGSVASLVSSPRINVQPQHTSSTLGKSGLSVSALTGGGSLALVTRGVSKPTVTLVTRPATVSTTPQVSGTTRPIVRLASGTSLSSLPTTPISLSTTTPFSIATNPSLTLGTPTLKRKREEDDDYDKL